MISTLRQYWHAQAFLPFTIHLANGKSLAVPHPDFFFMSAKGGQIFVSEEDDEVHVLNPLVIVSVSRAEEPTAA
jgi:hypothetical protein